MKVELWLIGKTSFPYLQEGIRLYEKRLGHYLPFEIRTLPDIKNGGKLPPGQLKEKEGASILDKLKKEDFLVLLDEKGKALDSVRFANFMEQKMQQGTRRMIFQVGGAFGFSPAVYQRANFQLTLSAMTFSHQMVRLFFVEQLYRAMTIIRGEKYHNV